MQSTTKTTKAQKTTKRSNGAAKTTKRSNGAAKTTKRSNGAGEAQILAASASEAIQAITMRGHVIRAMHTLTLLQWALTARLEDGDEIEAFTAPVDEARKSLLDLCEEPALLGGGELSGSVLSALQERIRRAVLPLRPLEWALALRLEDEDEAEAFLTPIEKMRAALASPGEEIEHGITPTARGLS